MNQQDVKKETREQGQRGEQHFLQQRGKRKKNRALLRVLTGAISIVSVMIFVVGMLLLVLPLFRIKTIEVRGNSTYTTDEIIAASGLTIGQEILSVDKNAVRKNIWTWDKQELIGEIGIGCYPNKVVIEVKETPYVMYAEYDGKYISLDQSLRVLRESETEGELADFLKVKLPKIATCTVGECLTFQNSEIDRGYVKILLCGLDDAGVLENITSLDLSKKYQLSVFLNETCRVELGDVSELGEKLALTKTILSGKESGTALLAVVDVSNPEKPTYRPLSSADALLG